MKSIAFGPIARKAKKLKIGGITWTAFRHRDSVIDFHFVIFLSAACALAFLFSIKQLNIFDAEIAAIIGFVGTVLSSADAGQLAYALNIGGLPLLYLSLVFSLIFIAVPLDFRAVTSRVFGPSFSGPGRLKPRMGGKVSPLIFCETGHASSGRSSALGHMAILARLGRFVESLSCRARSLTFRRWPHANDFYHGALRGTS